MELLKLRRQIVLDTETTGIGAELGHRIVEVGCVLLGDRRVLDLHFHSYLNADRDSDPAALQVHKLTRAFLAEHPRFADIADAFLEFVSGAELLIHNAAFDVAFINAELKRAGARFGKLEQHCSIVDTLGMARKQYPGQRNSLDALCRRLEVDNRSRIAHGALLDARLLGEVYLAMTRGQNALALGVVEKAHEFAELRCHGATRVKLADAEELAAHAKRLAQIEKVSKGNCLWLKLEPPELTDSLS